MVGLIKCCYVVAFMVAVRSSACIGESSVLSLLVLAKAGSEVLHICIHNQFLVSK